MVNYPDDDSHQSVGARLHGYNSIRSQWEPVAINSEGQLTTETTSVNAFLPSYGSGSYKTPGNDTSVYAIGDLMGTATEFLNMFASAGGTGLLVGVTVIDAIKTKPDFDILIFNSNPNLTSTNNAALALATSDLRTLQARVQIRLGHWSDLNSQSIAIVPVAGVAPHAGAQFVQAATAGTSLWAAVEMQSTSTFTATNTIEIKLAVVK